MADIVTERATKGTYLSEVGGSNIINFQFSLPELNFMDGGKFNDVVKTGQFATDVMWISGKPNSFQFDIFIDRTQESLVQGDYNADPFNRIRRFPGSNPRYDASTMGGLIDGIASGNSGSGFASSLRNRGTQKDGNSVAPSVYSASPQFAQSAQQYGIYNDVEKLLYFVRPKGFQLGSATVEKDGSLSVTDFAQGRFQPPPMVRFFHGTLWREGYIMDVNYSLTVMNKQLVPLRMEAKVTFAIIRYGYLTELTPAYLDNQDVLNADEQFTR